MRGALVLADLVDLEHERHVVVGLEPVGDALAQDRGREGAERLAALDLVVEDVLHVGPARVAQDRAVAERARAPLHATLEPADDLAVGDAQGGQAAELVGIFDPADRAAGGLEGGPVVRDLGFDGAVLERGAEEGVVHDVTARAVEGTVPDGEGGADRAAGVACRGLDVEVGEGSALEDLTVRDRVHGAAAG